MLYFTEVYFKDEHHSDSSDDNEDMETATTSFVCLFDFLKFLSVVFWKMFLRI